MTAYYNEHDPKAAAWLRELIKQGHIAPGVVDEQSIEDVKPSDLEGYTQCHFFAGVGVWSYALRRAGWPDDRPVWTGSCPCQPFSAAGKGAGMSDERHLWPAWYHLITQCQPSHIFGEQVASKDGLGWLDLVQADLEGAGYTNGAADICAAGIGAPHIRQRLWFVAERVEHPEPARPQGWVPRRADTGRENIDGHAGRVRATSRMADSECLQRHEKRPYTSGCGDRSEAQRVGERPALGGPVVRAAPTNGLWRDVDWLYCRDEKWRPVEPGTFPLVDGSPARVVRLRGYGNAINAEVATTFIEAYLTIDTPAS